MNRPPKDPKAKLWPWVDAAGSGRLHYLFSEAAIVGLATIAAQSTVILREGAISRTLGRSQSADVVTVGLVFTSTVAQLVAGSFQTTVVPLAVDAQVREGELASKRVLGWSISVYALIAAILLSPFLLTPSTVAAVVAPARLQFALGEVLGILSIFGLCYTFTELTRIVFGLRRRYAVFALFGALGNLAFAGLLMATSPSRPRGVATCAAFAFVAAAAGGFALLARSGLVELGGNLPRNKLLTLGRRIPPTLGAGIIMIGTSLVDNAFALQMGTGTAATLGFSQKWPNVAAQLPALALSMVLLRSISEDLRTVTPQHLRQKVRRVSMIGFLGGWVAVFLGWWLGPEAIRFTLVGGSFSLTDAERVVGIQNILFLHVPFYIGGIAYLRLLNALHQNWSNFVLGILMVLINAFLDWYLAVCLTLGAAGIVVSTVATYALSCATLVVLGERAITKHAAATFNT